MPAPASAVADDRPLLGVVLRLASATCFAFMGAILKLASARGVTAPEMIAWRNGFGLPLVAAWVVFGPGVAKLRPRRPLAHVTRSAIGLVSMLLTFQALILLPLAEATTITFAAPVFATLLSVMILGEVVGRQRWLAVALGFAGVLVVMRPGGALPLVGVLVALGAAIGQALVAITLRQIGRSEHTAAIVFWFTVLTTAAGLATLPWFGHAHDAATWGLLVVAGLIGGSGQILMTSSLRHASVAVVAPLDYAQILWATAFGWLLFAHPPTATTLAGAGLIVAGGLLTAWREHRVRQERVAATPPDL